MFDFIVVTTIGLGITVGVSVFVGGFMAVLAHALMRDDEE